MSRKKRTVSKVLLNAAARAAGLESVDTTLDLGNGMTLEVYRTAIDEAQAKQAAYNTLLSWGDEARHEFDSAEASVRALSDRMLAAVAAKCGRDSNEYQKAGGTRLSDRKRAAARSVPETPAIAKAARVTDCFLNHKPEPFGSGLWFERGLYGKVQSSTPFQAP